MVKNIAWVFAVVFLAIGVLGFVPGITSGGHLLGIFEVDAVHNIIHILTGIIFALVAWKYMEHASMAFKIFGVVYALVTVIGFFQGDTVLGLFAANMADHVLHLVVAAIALYVGFFMKDGGASAGAGGGGMQQPPMGGNMPNNQDAGSQGM